MAKTPKKSGTRPADAGEHTTASKVYMQLKIPVELKKEFQHAAVDQGLTLSTLFERVWAVYKAQRD